MSPAKLFGTSRALLILLAVLGLWQCFTLAWMVHEYTLPGPVQDSWGIVPYLQDRVADDSHWFDRTLWQPQNGHRLVFLRLEFLMDYHWFHGSNQLLIAITTFILLAEIFCFHSLLRDSDANSATRWKILLLVVTLVSFPTMAWSYQHIFNIHMVHCALFAVASCILMAKACARQSAMLFSASIACAILCNFSSFSLSTLWPALLLIALLGRTKKMPVAALVASALVFSYVYLAILPLGSSPDSNFSSLNLLENIFSSGSALPDTLKILVGFFDYLVTYLSLPPADLWMNRCVTLLSFTWFLLALTQALRCKTSLVESACLGIMAFGICLAITTGIARGALGDLSYGLRFQPLVLMYWAGFFIHLLHSLLRQRPSLFNPMLFLAFLWIASLSAINTGDMGKRLAEDYTRFAKVQMAYLTDNLGENALYENMVAEWRKNSYVGIVAAIPFLEQQAIGIYNTALGHYVQQHKTSVPVQTLPPCFAVTVTEKSRNNDPLIRNLFVAAQEPNAATDYPYLLLYDNQRLVGIAFRKRDTIFHAWTGSATGKSTWLGISKIPMNRANLSLIAFRRDNALCRATLSE